jgi:hypothetical protein
MILLGHHSDQHLHYSPASQLGPTQRRPAPPLLPGLAARTHPTPTSTSITPRPRSSDPPNADQHLHYSPERSWGRTRVPTSTLITPVDYSRPRSSGRTR